ncbi:unnamed protein product [Protopolystoma xenopodis]|uniref:Uncharacterized protein n=1 Tax=Protopolystoma xenopodis TaxID=117903 RepID=A0A448WCY8_9PLAT|nr:unnamed protein product [Protopolystoma xenopodis]
MCPYGEFTVASSHLLFALFPFPSVADPAMVSCPDLPHGPGDQFIIFLVDRFHEADPDRRLEQDQPLVWLLRLTRLTDDAGETFVNVPSPQFDPGDYHAHHRLRASSFLKFGGLEEASSSGLWCQRIDSAAGIWTTLFPRFQNNLKMRRSGRPRGSIRPDSFG